MIQDQIVEITCYWSPETVKVMHRLEGRLRRLGWRTGARSGRGLITFIFEGPRDERAERSIMRAAKKVGIAA